MQAALKSLSAQQQEHAVSIPAAIPPLEGGEVFDGRRFTDVIWDESGTLFHDVSCKYSQSKYKWT